MPHSKIKNFALIGAAGYVAPKHMQAIKETNNTLSCAFDIRDSVGIIDSYFPQADFFVEFERFDRHISKLQNSTQPIDYVSICSPNYLHDSHIRFALKNDAHAICEKPLVLNPWNAEALIQLEETTSKRIYNILQLRLHQDILNLKAYVQSELKKNPHHRFKLELTYITSRGKWYFISWKGDESKSGGVITNIGIHFFDMLQFVFGDLTHQGVITHFDEKDFACGSLELQHADVKWFLSINADHLPQTAKAANKRTYRSIRLEEKEIEFSQGFENLHTKSYEEILKGNGFGLKEAIKSIQLISLIKNSPKRGLNGDYHPFALKAIRS